LYWNCSLILKFRLVIRKTTNKVSRKNRKSKSVYTSLLRTTHAVCCSVLQCVAVSKSVYTWLLLVLFSLLFSSFLYPCLSLSHSRSLLLLISPFSVLALFLMLSFVFSFTLSLSPPPLFLSLLLSLCRPLSYPRSLSRLRAHARTIHSSVSPQPFHI